MRLPPPTLQIEFATLLHGARTLVLSDALRETVKSLSVKALDAELAVFVDDDCLTKLGSSGIRGETLFPVPILLRSKPSLIGYFRLLYGYSQKQFYTPATGCSVFKAMETRGVLSTVANSKLEDLCRVFSFAGRQFLEGLGGNVGQNPIFHELTLLTLGAQFRGGANNQRGAEGVKTVFEVVRRIVEAGISSAGERLIEIRNAAGKRISIEFSADPDIFIISHLDNGETRPIVAIEVKAGEDHSNIWNRVGEAEKSHQQAKAKGVTECWTIINDAKAEAAKLKMSSPTTNRFYQLSDLTNSDTASFDDFSLRVRDMVGLG